MKKLLNNEFALEEDESVLFDTEKAIFQPYYIIILVVCFALGFVNGPNPLLLCAVVGGVFMFIGASKTKIWVTESRLISARTTGAFESYKYDFIETAKILRIQKGNGGESAVKPEEQFMRRLIGNDSPSHYETGELHRQNANLAAGMCDITIFIDTGSRRRTDKWTFEAMKDGHQFIARLASLLGFTSPDGFVWFNPEE